MEASTLFFGMPPVSFPFHFILSSDGLKKGASPADILLK
ncbi:hypothetical protein KNP414_06043 [Paenibacillus mucilaginosus KNP414]|uniref:Uncharacterized protein n=1 Tax=Paenibacillus mucilaginosus (strain KNP414) TaxID=1036673 RepID=F8FEG8_PAEMK|nr:hypothetical protein KNP414_06043 [Paenibacillus mucilaginosus KNP414]